ncbi:hypothetical protein O181_094758 [Austropuccinia psidii MF-1]|uniref:Uncharacterized protein n=1 Tax=Austropuccinia psidii MF-1 TaxID=1389203 RepID=A0A9Q3J3R8_9BASI|nr:hypothetical protein [Austropuccinia psidii MF-1]
MMLVDLNLKQPLDLPNLMLKKENLYHGFANTKKDYKHYILKVRIYDSQKTLIQCGGDSEHSVKSRTTEQSSEKDIIHILEELTTINTIFCSRVNLKIRFNTDWKGSVDKNPKENSNNMKYKSAYIIIKCHTFQSTTNLANACPRKAKVNEIDIEKEPDVKKDDDVENKDDKSSIFSESSKDIENINASFDIMESYSHLPQLSNGQLELSKIQDAQKL